MSISKGDIAPDFTLNDTDNKKVTLSKFRDVMNVVLLFFPLAFTGVCTTELCSTRDNLTVYENLNAQVFGISVDSPFTLKEFKKANRLNFPLLSDFNKNVSKSYGALYEHFYDLNGVSKRSAFIIDKKGVVQYAQVLEDAGQLPDFAKLQETLKSL